MTKDKEQQRQQLWCDVYVAYVGAANSTNQDGASNWADKAVERFDAAFPNPKPKEQNETIRPN